MVRRSRTRLLALHQQARTDEHRSRLMLLLSYHSCTLNLFAYISGNRQLRQAYLFAQWEPLKPFLMQTLIPQTSGRLIACTSASCNTYCCCNGDMLSGAGLERHNFSQSLPPSQMHQQLNSPEESKLAEGHLFC